MLDPAEAKGQKRRGCRERFLRCGVWSAKVSSCRWVLTRPRDPPIVNIRLPSDRVVSRVVSPRLLHPSMDGRLTRRFYYIDSRNLANSLIQAEIYSLISLFFVFFFRSSTEYVFFFFFYHRDWKSVLSILPSQLRSDDEHDCLIKKISPRVKAQIKTRLSLLLFFFLRNRRNRVDKSSR